jgi:hypothetical protein
MAGEQIGTRSKIVQQEKKMTEIDKLPDHIIEKLAHELVAKHGGSYEKVVQQMRVIIDQPPTIRKILLNVSQRVSEAINKVEEERNRPFKRSTPVRKIIGNDELRKIIEVEWACGQSGLTEPNQ